MITAFNIQFFTTEVCPKDILAPRTFTVAIHLRELVNALHVCVYYTTFAVKKRKEKRKTFRTWCSRSPC